MKDWIEQARQAANHLLQTSNSLAGSPGEVDDRLKLFAEAEAAAEPFLQAAPEKLDEVRGQIAGLLSGTGLSVDELLGDRESEASREVQNLYRIALKIAQTPEAKEVVIDLSGNKAFRSLEKNHSEIAVDLVAHLQDFGWVRTVGTGLDILSPKEVMQRIQVALLRWNAETIAKAVDPPSPKPQELPEGVEDLLDAYRTVSGDPAFSPGLPVKAKWLARLFIGEVASTLGCKLHQALNTPAGALLEAVQNGTALPEQAVRPFLEGAAVSLGRAVGRVRVILDADDGGRIQIGDIIVTNLSTPTYEGQPSIFPYRTVPSVPVEKASAIVTDEGGLLSHAAIICRENSVPSLLGTEGATETLRDGMIVEVDATRANGTVTILSD